MLNEIYQAELFATFIHQGQKRRGGEYYINHPKRIAQMGVDKKLSDDNICARWLHDTLEDTKHRLGTHQLIATYFSPHTMWLVALLTHEKHESYEEYIEKILKVPEAMDIKFDDMIDNTVDDIPITQWKKYRDICIKLQLKNIAIPNILCHRLKLG